MRTQRIVTIVFAVVLVGGLIAAGYFLWRPMAQPRTGTQTRAAAWPLTGEPAPDEAATQRRVISVKIDNIAVARPQTGLNEADVVYEELAEGGITRFNALFQSHSPRRLGPVRSARPPDIHIVHQYNAMFAYAGANSIVEQMIASANIDDLNFGVVSGPYSRSSQRRAPHNLYVNLVALRQAAASKGYPAEATPRDLSFGAPPEGGTSAETANVTFNASNRIVWRWDASTKAFKRSINGAPQVDTNTGAPYAAANVVVLFADEVQGSRKGTTDFRLDTQGDALVYRDGRRFDARWTAAEDSPPTFTTANDAALPLAKGQTWIEVLPSSARGRFP